MGRPLGTRTQPLCLQKQALAVALSKLGLRHGGLTPVKCHLSHAVEMVHRGFPFLKAKNHGTIFEGKVMPTHHTSLIMCPQSQAAVPAAVFTVTESPVSFRTYTCLPRCPPSPPRPVTHTLTGCRSLPFLAGTWAGAGLATSPLTPPRLQCSPMLPLQRFLLLRVAWQAGLPLRPWGLAFLLIVTCCGKDCRI